ncbi:hypothetical protein INQ41_04135 [Lysobacter ciconiae]|uniref:Uncharacterized protein n=1 Tax=Novilysobacter ciconiae TaxID=2781022 RepID=A0A7S6UHC8_9GAMM|nr:hypothetical protein [Lysobacter ciconiae]QOW20229.1 hypothetical protein INQ41_04135 [Lysobacter ciconiae]
MTNQDRIDTATQAAASLVRAVAEVGQFLTTGSTQTLSECDSSFLERVASTMADFAWNGKARAQNELEEGLTELAVAVELLSANFTLPDGSDCLSPDEKEAIQRLSNAATARWELDRGEPIRVEQLAALAGVSEKTVRTATNPKSANPLPVTKSGYWTFIEAEDALAWLGRRKDFTPTHLGAQGPQQPQITDAAVLGTTCQNWRETADLSLDQLAHALQWGPEQALAYSGIESQAPGNVIAEFPPQALQQLALHLDLPDPAAFAREAYAVLALAHAAALSATQINHPA